MDAVLSYTEGGKSAVKPIKKEEVTKEEYEAYLKKKAEYEKQQKEIETQRKTYEAVELMNFGWINCDRFWNDPSPKTDIVLNIADKTLTAARIYAVFKDINSILTESYWKDRQDSLAFRSLPTDKELTILALSAKDTTPYIFETTIRTKDQNQIKIEFTPTTQANVQEKIRRLN